ncbi:hypothetical protein FSP39_014853 [Pinctada imbricata]|uniref:Chitin-binding type-4 domain-containing protein n=1 Tax=Pinctada imbricata TaxID=66713 RepID=A0AA88Y0L6_PINIB|nr:hypothetical protein FSP39_014853 [Pinctada imbricata]
MKTFALFVLWMLTEVEGHGYLLSPPGRSTMWLVGYSTPHNYQHNELFCGGFPVQWWMNGGRCGVCGDPYNGERENEPPNGKYATGTITRYFQEGDIMNVVVQITASHKGYFEFRLCPSNDASVTVTQECLNQNLLTEVTSGGNKVYVDDSSTGTYNFGLRLPPNVTCNNCVLQWRYRTGNRWGCYNNDYEKGPCGLGYGPQEEFYACSDIKISPLNGPATGQSTTTTMASSMTSSAATSKVTTPSTTAAATTTTTPLSSTLQPTTTQSPTKQPTTTPSPTKQPTTTSPVSTIEPKPEPKIVCKSLGAWEGSAAMTYWCKINCNAPTPYCPPSHCACDREDLLKLDTGLLGTGKDCVSVRRDPGWDMWCKHNCPLGLCYLGTMCVCSDMSSYEQLDNIYGPSY